MGLNQGCSTSGAGFKGAVRALYRIEGPHCCVTAEELPPPNFIPDAWEIDSDNRRVVILEEINHNPFLVIKLIRVRDLWWSLDAIEYELCLFTTTAWGGRCEFPLWLFAYMNIPEEKIKSHTTVGDLIRMIEKGDIAVPLDWSIYLKEFIKH